MRQIDISISIVSYNTCDLLRSCLRAVFNASENICFEVFVVDNASKDESVDMVRAEFPQVRLIRNKKNVGFAAANNIALAAAQGRYFVLLNSDTEVLDNALMKLVRFMDENPDCGVCCPQLLYPDGRLQKSYARFRYPKERAMWEIGPRVRDIKSILNRMRGRKSTVGEKTASSEKKLLDIPTQIDRPRGACFLVRRETIEKVRPMDERFFMYCEEVDWAWRMRKAGWKRYFVPAARVVHVWGGSTRSCKTLMDDIHTHSDYKYFYKHFGWRGWLLVRAGHGIGACLAFCLGMYVLFFGWIGWSDFTASEQFRVCSDLLRKFFIVRDIRPLL